MKSLFKKIIVACLSFEAKLLLRRMGPTVIAITGSVGKTSTKDAIYAAIKDSVPARKSEKGFNTDIGVPLTVLGLPNAWSNPLLWAWNCVKGLLVALFTKQYPEVLVLETGVDHPGDMAALTAWLEVDIMVVTRLPDVPVHVEFFKDTAAMRDEEFALLKALKAEGTLIYNADDTHITDKLPEVLQQTVSFSRMLPATVQTKRDEIAYQHYRPTGMTYDAVVGDQTVSIGADGTVGLHTVYAGAAAIAAAHELDIDLAQAAAALSQEATPPGRMRIIPGVKDTLLIDDSYNSSPVAAQSAVETLQELQYAKRKLAVLGDMRELGSHSEAEHRKLGERVAKVADVLLTVGIQARGIAAGALAAGMDEANIFQYEVADRAGRELQGMLQEGDAVLIKGSQGIRAEKIVKEVMASPEHAAQLLVRQDQQWQRVK